MLKTYVPSSFESLSPNFRLVFHIFLKNTAYFKAIRFYHIPLVYPKTNHNVFSRFKSQFLKLLLLLFHYNFIN